MPGRNMPNALYWISFHFWVPVWLFRYITQTAFSFGTSRINEHCSHAVFFCMFFFSPNKLIHLFPYIVKHYVIHALHRCVQKFWEENKPVFACVSLGPNGVNWTNRTLNQSNRIDHNRTIIIAIEYYPGFVVRLWNIIESIEYYVLNLRSIAFNCVIDWYSLTFDC